MSQQLPHIQSSRRNEQSLDLLLETNDEGNDSLGSKKSSDDEMPTQSPLHAQGQQNVEQRSDLSPEVTQMSPTNGTRPRITPYLLFCVLSGALSTFQFGYNSGVVNQPLDLMATCPVGYDPNDHLFPICIPMTSWNKGFFVSLFLIGGITGGLIAGKLAAHFGRKNILHANTIMFIVGGTCIALATQYWMLCLGRFIAGFGAGVGTVVLPLYIAEVSPVQVRGTTGSLNQLSIVTGVLTSVFVGMGLATTTTWRYMFAITVIPSLLQNILLPFAVKSPKWLAGKGRLDEAAQALKKLRGHGQIQDELKQIMSSVSNIAPEENHNSVERRNIGLRELFFVPELRKPLLAAFGLQLTQQFSGINTAIYYSTNIFSKTFSQSESVKLTAMVISINLIMTIVSLNLIERLGRKTLLLAAESIMATGALLSFALGTFNAHPFTVVAALMVYLAGFGLGIGSIPWLILPEVVPQYAVTPAATICSLLNWGSNAMLAFLMPTLISILAYKVFLVFFCLLVLFGIFTFFIVPETRGLTPEQVVAQSSYAHRTTDEIRPTPP